MITNHTEGVVISLHVIPGAPKSEIIGLHNNCLKIKIHAPPVDGKANAEIEKFIAALLGLSKKNVRVLKGERSKSKKVLIKSLSIQQLEAALKPLL